MKYLTDLEQSELETIKGNMDVLRKEREKIKNRARVRKHRAEKHND